MASVSCSIGGMARSRRQPRAEFQPCGRLIPADFNGDGKLDLFATDVCRFGGGLLLGDGNGKLSPGRTVAGAGLATPLPVLIPLIDSCVALPARRSDTGCFLIFLGTGFPAGSAARIMCVIDGYSLPIAAVEPEGTPGVQQLMVRLPAPGFDFW